MTVGGMVFKTVGFPSGGRFSCTGSVCGSNPSLLNNKKNTRKGGVSLLVGDYGLLVTLAGQAGRSDFVLRDVRFAHQTCGSHPSLLNNK
ncbi:MAG: hypothetical protein IKR09_01850, partial [Alphaproteobacteria bacterium]|nr:hypothetical protein [Alphaproteobacteria bacterium]